MFIFILFYVLLYLFMMKDNHSLSYIAILELMIACMVTIVDVHLVHQRYFVRTFYYLYLIGFYACHRLFLSLFYFVRFLYNNTLCIIIPFPSTRFMIRHI
jgi:hypothetical protein